MEKFIDDPVGQVVVIIFAIMMIMIIITNTML